MIIVRLAGGLGNQMFQYACGRALAARYSTSLALDHSFLEDRTLREGFTPRNYELNAFGIDLKIRRAAINMLFNAQQASARGREYVYYKESKQAFDNYFFAMGPNQYIHGYFQDEQYFSDIVEYLRDDFKFIHTPSRQNQVLADKIADTRNPVSVHVRRGDYLTIHNGEYYYICSPEYYSAAVKHIKERVGEPVFYVFSADDPKWAHDVFQKIDADYCIIGKENAGKYSYEDMRMMSLCRHHIIANSSFSWWGAWLNRSSDKIVVCPAHWYKKEIHQHSPALKEWILI
jgi:hypothetical protein